MNLQWLHLRDFRNYRDQKVEFTARKTILVGNNAQGKSNLLEAIELLASLKSHRASRDRDLVHNDHAQAQITAHVQHDAGSVDLQLILREKGRRTASVNCQTLRRQLDFLGQLNAVRFSSLDLDLVRGSPEARRDWLDSLAIQLEPVYAYILQQYNQVLRQRNALLKQLKQREEPLTAHQSDQLAIWDAQLAAAGSRVTRRRSRILQRLAPLAQLWHRQISGETEQLTIRYAPNVAWSTDDAIAVQQAFLAKIAQRRTAEQHQGKSMVGTHRDEIELTINETPARFYGSQGQQRTLVLALKLAELKLIEDVIGEPPLLLLDDVLAELDPTRQNHLLVAIQDRFQTLITTTHLDSFHQPWLEAAQILTVTAGSIRAQ
ncbi:MAG: DNA replication/repair protein RecF [Spirulinaceae cyanobacterium SM2_1_0]|nr:DNA replication/repair protein RecF [Spirulinaceae cyanobacterium SM2_1_0]